MYNQETNDKLSAKSAWWKKRDLDLSYSSVEPNIFCRSLSLSLSRLQIIQIWTSHRSHGVSFKSQDDKNNNLIITYNFQIDIIIVSETSGGTTLNPKKNISFFPKNYFFEKKRILYRWFYSKVFILFRKHWPNILTEKLLSKFSSLKYSNACLIDGVAT